MGDTRINLLNLSESALQDFVESCGQPRVRAKTLIAAIHKHGITDFDAMELSRTFKSVLKSRACITYPTVIGASTAEDGTQKWLLKVEAGNAIEAVFIPEKNRGTLCVSSQVGCSLNCDFCATGKQGFNRNLTMAEIIGQLWVAARALSPKGLHKQRVITNVVMMGMGEPLMNYEPVVDAMHWMLHDDAYGLSKYRVTLSTSGWIPKMKALQQDSPVSLAVSLHAPTNALRNQLVPLNKKYPLEVLIPMCQTYFSPGAKQTILFEYVMLDGVNDSVAQAKQLADLLKDCPGKINLIPFNPFPGTRYRCSKPEVIADFHAILVEAGFETRIRRTRGEHIAAACGQLAGEFLDKTGRSARYH